ncbi:MAG: hypothetical protein HY261_03425, partial [Chloroflexi bacterium]|nr:hypothetical protein [Chloroflexota bacterium]
MRTDARQALQIFTEGDYNVLAVDPDQFTQAAWYRDDFSGKSLSRLMGELKAGDPQPSGLPVPPDTERIGVWVKPSNPRATLEVRIRVRDANNRYNDYSLGRMNSGDWQYMETSLVPPNTRVFQPKAPLTLISLSIRQPAGPQLQAGAIYLDDLQALAGTNVTMLDPFDVEAKADSIEVLNDTPGASGDSFETSTTQARTPGGTSGAFIWGSGSSAAARGILLGRPTGDVTPLPAVASRSALEKLGAQKGDKISLSINTHVVPVKVIETAD